MKIHDVAEWFIIADDDVETAEIIKDKKLNNAYYHYGVDWKNVLFEIVP